MPEEKNLLETECPRARGFMGEKQQPAKVQRLHREALRNMAREFGENFKDGWQENVTAASTRQARVQSTHTASEPSGPIWLCVCLPALSHERSSPNWVWGGVLTLIKFQVLIIT